MCSFFHLVILCWLQYSIKGKVCQSVCAERNIIGRKPTPLRSKYFTAKLFHLGIAKFHSPKANFVEKKMPSYFLLFFCFITKIKSKMHAVITSSKLQTLKANGSSMHKSKKPMIQLRTKHKNATSGIMLTFFMYLPPFVLLVLV